MLNEEILQEMNVYLNGTTIEEILMNNRRMFRFQMRLKEHHLREDIAALDLSARAYNCLKRMGYDTVGKLAESIYTKPDMSSKRQLLKIRNLGEKTADEIMLKLFCYQFTILPANRKGKYLEQVKQMNNA